MGHPAGLQDGGHLRAEFEAETAYFYSAYEEENEALPLGGRRALVAGSGPIRIGQGIEFDYCSVHAAWALQGEGVKSIVVNSNPETVSTDFDTSDRLYFEPLDEESVRDILENEAVEEDGELSFPPSIVQFGGQTGINLSQTLDRAQLPIWARRRARSTSPPTATCSRSSLPASASPTRRARRWPTSNRR